MWRLEGKEITNLKEDLKRKFVNFQLRLFANFNFKLNLPTRKIPYNLIYLKSRLNILRREREREKEEKKKGLEDTYILFMSVAAG